MGYIIVKSDELYHYGILGQKWGIRRFQNPDGSLTEAGKKRYTKDDLENDIMELRFDSGKYGFLADTAVKFRYYDKLISNQQQYNEAVDSLLDHYIKLGIYSRQEAKAVRPDYFNPVDWLDLQYEAAAFWYNHHPKEKENMDRDVEKTRQKITEVMQRTANIGVKAAEAKFSKRTLEETLDKFHISNYKYQALAAYDDYKDSKRSKRPSK